MADILTVREITRRVKDCLELEFPFVWVRGQVSNLSRPASGHIYFSLKDEEASLSVVWFKRNQRPTMGHDPLTGEVFSGREAGPVETLDNGQEILCGGGLNVYPARGVYQLVAELVQDMGLGHLHQEFEALKERFAAKGYFAQERKRPLPRHAARVALVTAPDSAAIRDFLRLSGERGWGAAVRIYPTLVQGEEAPAQIAEAVQKADSHGWAEVIVLIRGGGSLEDLWAFNTEPVADAVYNASVPVLAGVGHEVDVSIADMVADVRAATPSHAAQLLWPERSILMQDTDEAAEGLHRSWQRFFRNKVQALEALEKGLAWLSPAARIGYMRERFQALEKRLENGFRLGLEKKGARLNQALHGLARSFGPEYFQAREHSLAGASGALRSGMDAMLLRKEKDMETTWFALEGLSPEKPLQRGYSLVRRKKDNVLVRGADQVEPGDGLHITVARGSLEAEVVATDKEDQE